MRWNCAACRRSKTLERWEQEFDEDVRAGKMDALAAEALVENNRLAGQQD